MQTLEQGLHEEALAQADRVLQIACARSLTIATAESCTGGLLAALLTDVPGRSHVFERGFVVYSEIAKCEMLAIDPALIAQHGAVSREVAEEMALGALKRSQAEVALAVTGFAGPGAEEDEEGLVHLACARRGVAKDHREEHFGPIGRAGVRHGTISVALEMLEESLSK